MKPSGAARVGLGVLVGLGVGYLTDPARGRARRARLADQTKARLRHEARALERRARHERGALKGRAYRALHPHLDAPVDDRALVDRVRSMALGRQRGNLAGGINVDAAEGVVTLRGQLASPSDIEEVVDAVRRVPGVVRVDSLLHLAGELPANKRDALHAGTTHSL